MYEIWVRIDGNYVTLVEVFESPEGYGAQVTVHSKDDTLGDKIRAWMLGETSCENSMLNPIRLKKI